MEKEQREEPSYVDKEPEDRYSTVEERPPSDEEGPSICEEETSTVAGEQLIEEQPDSFEAGSSTVTLEEGPSSDEEESGDGKGPNPIKEGGQERPRKRTAAVREDECEGGEEFTSPPAKRLRGEEREEGCEGEEKAISPQTKQRRGMCQLKIPYKDKASKCKKQNIGEG